MADLARDYCGVTSIIECYENDCSPENLELAFAESCAQMQDDDYLVFFFSGHGTEFASDSDGEDDLRFGEQSCPSLTLMTQEGALVDYSASRFAKTVSASANPRARILMVFDACHSGTIADLDNPAWANIEAISLCSSQDSEESEDTGKGGLFTQSLFFALQRLQQQGETRYSVGSVFNKMLKEGERVYGCKQHFWLEVSQAATPDGMAWPLLPMGTYHPPRRRGKVALEYGKVRALVDAPFPGQKKSAMDPSAAMYCGLCDEEHDDSGADAWDSGGPPTPPQSWGALGSSPWSPEAYKQFEACTMQDAIRLRPALLDNRLDFEWIGMPS